MQTTTNKNRPQMETIALLLLALVIVAMLIGYAVHGNTAGAIMALVFLCAVVAIIATPVK